MRRSSNRPRYRAENWRCCATPTSDNLNNRSLCIGIMSGTSLDGADAVLADFSEVQPKVLAFSSESYPADLRAELLALNTAGGNEIERSYLAANRLAQVYAQAAKRCLQDARVDAADVAAIGCHGQTVRHRPDLAFTVQLNNPALLAELTGCNVVAEFRSRDIAAGGQGAPLVPAFHEGVFHSADESRVVVNIGGIANLTFLAPHNPAWGYDCGTGNCLMDGWIAMHQGVSHDENGAWAATGNVLESLLQRLTDDPYFASPPPKSTGRDLFNMAWLASRLDGTERPQDVQATLLALTSKVIIGDVARNAPSTKRILVCGGGASNAALMADLAGRFSCGVVEKTDAHGVPTQQVEALAFAWFALRATQRRTVDMTATTGAAHACVLGATYPA
ncbi:MAG: anhydro-N-acetylmuramic acid kinase [Betaproteobacteria bacterium]